MQFQEQAKNRALEDDVRFVVDGFREGSALATCALKAMSLFADPRSRQGMAEVWLRMHMPARDTSSLSRR